MPDDERTRSAGRRTLRKRATSNNIVAPSSVVKKLADDAAKVGDSSADGDYVILREIRQVSNPLKRNSSTTDRRQMLETIIDEIKAAKEESDTVTASIVDSVDAHQNVTFNHAPEASAKNLIVSPDVLLDWKDRLFSAIEQRDLSGVLDVLTGAKRSGVEASDIIDEETGMNPLHRAIFIGAHDVAMFILERVSKSVLLKTYEVLVKGNASVRNTLQLIAEKGSVELAEAFMKKVGAKLGERLMMEETSVEISGQRPRTFPCLHLAAFMGHEKLTKFFIDMGTPINHPNGKQDTALLWAARWGHIEVMRLLISRGANPNLENDKGSTALYWAVRYNLPEAVSILIHEGRAKIDQTRKLGFVAPMILASALGYEKVVDILLKSGADANLKIRGGDTALHQAAKEGHAKVVELLVNNGAKINEQDDGGNTPLTLAAKSDNAEIVQLLLSHGAVATHKNHEGEGVWQCALMNADNTTLAVLVREMMRARAAGCTRKYYTNRPPLCMAAHLGAINKIKFLLDIGLSTSETDNLGNNLVHYAALSNNSEVITQFKSSVDLDCQNQHGDTALHTACSYGNADVINVLLNSKAKANIKNSKGEIALHVIARSANASVDSVTKLVDYMTKTHSWDSLHMQDNDGNNALHLATMFASIGVIWELRSLTTKQKNNEGCTPFHTAVVEGRPEVLHTMLDIYEVIKRDANLNSLNLHNESVLHLAATAGDTSSVSRLVLYGADLATQDINGDTVLHRLATKMDDMSNKSYDEVIDAILKDSVRWWCLRNDLMYPDDDVNAFRRIKREALHFLISGIRNKQGLTVITLSAKIGCKSMLDKILMIPYVNYFTFGHRARMDITHLMPTTSKDSDDATPSCIEVLADMDDLYIAGRTLDVPPLRKIESIYATLCTWMFAFFMLAHLAYMVAYSVMSITIVEILRRGTTNQSGFASLETALYVVVSIEPGIMLCAGILFLVKLNSRFSTIVSDRKPLMAFFVLCVDNMSIVAGIMWSALTIAWLVLYSLKHHTHLYVLAVSLWFGWLYSISFARGIKNVHYFWRMLKVMVARDVFRFLFVYLFVLLAFSIAMHVLFQVSMKTASHYTSVFDTLFMTFNLMLGMVWLFEDNFEQDVVESGHSPVVIKIFVIIYLILSTVVLLNVLIAMMNDSYKTIKDTQTVIWRVDSVRLGMAVEHYLPWSIRAFSSVKIQRGVIDQSGDDSTINKDIRWYIDVPLESVDKKEHHAYTNVAEGVAKLASQLEKGERTIMEAFRCLQDEFSEIRAIAHDFK